MNKKLISLAAAFIAIVGGVFFILQPKDSSPLSTISPTITTRPPFSQLPDAPAATAKPTPAPTATVQPKPQATPTPKPTANKISAALGKEFTLRKNQTATISGTGGLEVKVTAFHNGYCPDGVNCYWSGMGVEIEYRLAGQVVKGINRTQAFGYITKIVKTDYNTYATLKVEK